MLEVLRRNPVLQLGGNKTITLADIRPPAKSLSLSAEAVLKPGDTAGRARLRPRERRGQREARLRGGPRGHMPGATRS